MRLCINYGPLTLHCIDTAHMQFASSYRTSGLEAAGCPSATTLGQRSLEHADMDAFGRTITLENHLSFDIQPTRHPLTENITLNIRWRTSPTEITFQTDETLEWRGRTLECGAFLIDGNLTL